MKIVIIGGVNIETTLCAIEEEIIALSAKEHPRVLFLPTASYDDTRNYKFIKEAFEVKRNCTVDSLLLIKHNHTYEEVRIKILSSDIIYIGGGYVDKLLEVFREQQVVQILEEASEKGIVIAGISAGAIWMGEKYYLVDDTSKFEVQNFKDYKSVECESILPFNICPHYNLPGYHEKLVSMVKTNQIGIGLENNCAIEFVGDTYRVISSEPHANAYKIMRVDGEICKTVINKDVEFRKIETLSQRL